MKIYKLPALSESGGSEYCLGCEDLGTQSVYMLYGRLMVGEDKKTVQPKTGYEEILLILNGTIEITKGNTVFTISNGEALHIKAGDKILLNNTGGKEAVYITAGGIAGGKL